MCVKTAINAQLKKLIAQLMQLKKLITRQLYRKPVSTILTTIKHFYC